MEARPSQAHWGKTVSFIALAFAAGIAASLVAFRWAGTGDWESPVVVASRGENDAEAAATVTAAPTERPRMVIVDNSVHPRQAIPPNPFARTTSNARAQSYQSIRPAYAASPPSTYSHGYQEYVSTPETSTPTLTLAWVRKFRAACAHRAEYERARCARLAESMERILDTTITSEAWPIEMEQQLLDLLTGFGSKDFSYREVNCSSTGCVIYWQTENYAKPFAAGTQIVQELLARGWLKRDDSSQPRMHGFDPTTSVAWETLVLERAPQQPAD